MTGAHNDENGINVVTNVQNKNEIYDVANIYNYAKQEGFCFHKRHCFTDPTDSTVAHRRTFEYMQARIHQAEKAILVEDRRDRDSEIIALISEFKNEIPTKGLPNIIEEYFPEMHKLLKEYLIPQKIQKQCDQMSQSLCYDVFLVDNWSTLLEKYGFGMGHAKKALDYAIRANKVDKFVEYLKKFIEETKGELDIENIANLIVGDPIRVQHKGCQPNRYKSEGEIPYKRKICDTTNASNHDLNENELAQ
ncbi:10757_t:CDS:2, partial [Racocetra fulgida]